MRLIDADALKEKKVYSLERHEKIVPVAEIDWMPTIDAIHVVRCQDCIHFEPENAEEGDTSGRCRNNYAPCQNQQVEMMWFCADGEREEGR